MDMEKIFTNATIDTPRFVYDVLMNEMITNTLRSLKLCARFADDSNYTELVVTFISICRVITYYNGQTSKMRIQNAKIMRICNQFSDYMFTKKNFESAFTDAIELVYGLFKGETA